MALISKKALRPCLILLIISIQVGCSEYYGNQPPAPVYGEPVTNPYQSTRPQKPLETTVTKPLSAQPPLTGSMQPIEPISPPSNRAEQYSPAVIALLSESERNSQSGDLDSAVADLERALRIEPRNPALLNKLAEVRLKQGKPRLAEDLAKKAELLAGRRPFIKRNSWLLISRARKMQGNYYGAKEAQMKADSFIAP